MTQRQPTGIDVLDRKLDGGIPPGRIVVLSATTTSQSELFLYEVASVHKTVYLTTERSEQSVRTTLSDVGTGTGDVAVRGLGDDPLSKASDVVHKTPDEAALIVDPMVPLERCPPDRYREFLNGLEEQTRARDGITVLHCLDRRTVPENRDTTEYMADIVFDLSTEVRGDTLENRLVVPKFRGGQALEEMIKLNLTADVSIDISRKIA